MQNSLPAGKLRRWLSDIENHKETELIALSAGHMRILIALALETLDLREGAKPHEKRFN